MLKAILGITKEPFANASSALLPQQQDIANMLSVHAHAGGGLSVIVGEPGVGKTRLREHVEQLAEQRDVVVASCSRTLHTYGQLLNQLAESMALSTTLAKAEKQLIEAAFKGASEGKTLYVLIDEAHLIDSETLRKLRLLFDRFPKRHNLILLGQPSLLTTLSLAINRDLKSRVTYSVTLWPLTDEQLRDFITAELHAVNLGQNTFDEAAIELILRSADGNVRLCRNLCRGSLIEACKESKKTVMTTHVNAVLIQPHWRSQDELIKNPVPTDRRDHRPPQ